MAYEPLIRDSDGSGEVALRKATTTEENYLAYRMGLYLADSANISPAFLTTSSSDGTAIGSHANTYFNVNIGQQVVLTDTTTETVTLYQKNPFFNQSDSDVRRILEHSIDDGQTRIDEFDSADITGLSNRLVSRMFTSDYPGTMRLATAAPSGDYTLVQEAFRDTRGNDDSDVNIYNLYKRTSMTAPDTIRPFSIKRASGKTGAYQGLQALSDRQVEQTFGSRARSLIDPGTSSVGAYQLRSAVQGAPTDAGTWVSKGTATDTRNVAVEEDYTRNCQVTRFTDFLGNYTGNYTGTFQNTTTNVFAGNYLRDFTGNFIGTYTGEKDYLKDFLGNYTGNFTQTFTGNYNPTYTGNFLRDYTGNFARDYLRDFTGDFTGNFLSDNETGPFLYENNGTISPNHGYNWRYSLNSTVVDIWYEGIRYTTPAYSTTTDALSATEITVTSGALNGRTFVRGPIQINNVSGQFHYEIAEKYLGADTGPLYVIDYSRNYTRVAAEGYITTSFSRNFTGAHPTLPTYDYLGNFITTSYTGNYTGNFSAIYMSEFLGAFTRNSTTNFTTNSTRAFTTTYTDAFAQGFTDLATEYTRARDSNSFSSIATETYIGTFTSPFDYQGTSTAFTTDRTVDSIGNYIAEFDVERDILETYSATYTGNFVGDFVGNFIGYELSPTNTTINTYTLYVRVA